MPYENYENALVNRRRRISGWQRRADGNEVRSEELRPVPVVTFRHGSPKHNVRELVQILRCDLSYAFRVLRRDLGFTAAAMGTLSLAGGASTAIFSVLYARTVPGFLFSARAGLQPALRIKASRLCALQVLRRRFREDRLKTRPLRRLR